MNYKTLKTLAVFMVCTLCGICFISCKDNDDDKNLSGKWIDKGYQLNIQNHYNKWKNKEEYWTVPDGSYRMFEFSGSSVKIYCYIYTFDGTFENYPDLNGRYQRLGTAKYGNANLTWYYYLDETSIYILKSKSVIISNGWTGSYDKGRLYLLGSEYERFK